MIIIPMNQCPQIEYLVQEITQRLKVSNKIQTGRIKFPQISNAQIYNVLQKVIVRTVTTFLFSSAKHKQKFFLHTLTLTETLALHFIWIKEKMFNFLRCVSQVQTSEVSIDSAAQSIERGVKEIALTAFLHIKSV